nr:lysosomal beta glucosidase-like [Ipomoea trifida]
MKIPTLSFPLLALLALSACMGAGAESEYKAYKDPTRKIGSRIRDLMGRMTLEEKIGQMTQLDRQNLTAAEACRGRTRRRRNADLVKRIGAATALEARATGIPYVFAPCIAVCRDPRWGRCYESYSEDVEIVKKMTELIPGLQGDIPPNHPKGIPYVGGKTKVAACAKHFVGDGGTTKGIDENNTVINWHELTHIHMPGYLSSIVKGTTILTGITRTVDPETKVVYNENPGTDFVKSNNFSYAVVVVGESPYAEFFGDNLNLTIPDPGLNTISNVCQTVKCVVVLISGRPVVIEPYLNSTGKLSRTWFKNVDQLPMNVGDPNYDPLFPFGFGLTTKV